MRIAYLDCFSGISGDMFLGALVDAGVSPELLEQTVAALGVEAKLEITRVLRNGISATKVDVVVRGEKDLPREVYQEQKAAKAHAHEHGHDHAHEHEHGDARHEHGRGLAEIRAIIAGAPISAHAKQAAVTIFENLGAAEAKIHNTDIDSVQFHEVGAVDAIVDIVCAAVGAEALGAEQWVCSPLNVGGGTVQCAHGVLPVPAPATLELLQGAPIYSSGVNRELVTPTGAAIVKTLARLFGEFPKMRVGKVGYGAGYRDLPAQPNVLRLTVGEVEEAPCGTEIETITVLEANIDDLSPQVIGYFIDRALVAGALDVFTVPVQMKKNRPGLLLTVLAKPEDEQRMAGMMFAETTTLGLRVRQERRYALPRRHITVATPWGDVRIKVAGVDEDVTNYAPEFEDCRRIAQEHGVALKDVMNEAVRAYLAGRVEQHKNG
jgi:hypothetical protein